MKIRSNDSNLPYKTTTKTPLDSKRDIDGELARYGIKRTAWIWDIDNFHEVVLQFQFSERFQEIEINPVVVLKPPLIWKVNRRGKPDEIDARMSMRLFFWYIKNALAWSYANQSERVVAFLSYVQVTKSKTLKDIVLPRLEELKQFEALPDKSNENLKVLEHE